MMMMMMMIIITNKPDMCVLDKVKKEWFIIEGTACLHAGDNTSKDNV